MTNTPTVPPRNLATAELSPASRLLLFFGKLAMCAVGYIVFAGLIYLTEALGESMGLPKLGILGLAIDVMILSVLMIFFSDRLGGVFSAMGPVLALLVVILFFAATDVLVNREHAAFWRVYNLRSVAVQSSTIAVAALGMTLIIIAGGIDLSAGTALALCATVFAWSLTEEYSIWVALPASILVGCAAGLINGALISSLRVVPFIITLGSMSVYLGIAKFVADQGTIHTPPESIPGWITGLVEITPDPAWISWPLLPNFANGVWLALLLAIAMAVLLHLTLFGRHVFALGSNESTARLCGINVPLTKIAVYTLAGLFVGMAGIYQFARVTVGNPESGIGMELKVIAAVVIGGGSLNGGKGSVVGTLTGSVIMYVIASGCTMLELENATQDIVIGCIIVVAVAIDQLRQRRMSR